MLLAAEEWSGGSRWASWMTDAEMDSQSPFALLATTNRHAGRLSVRKFTYVNQFLDTQELTG
jgi:hypothetical protein